MEQESADVPIWKVLKVGDEFGYEYDFGTTTKLSLKVVGELTATGPKNKILLIARNAAEQYKCKKCGKPAEYICNECVWDQKDPFYCEACLEEHGCEEGMSLPITNSPRWASAATVARLTRMRTRTRHQLRDSGNHACSVVGLLNRGTSGR